MTLSNQTRLITRKGELPPQCFLPVIDDKSALGALIKPYLPVVACGAVYSWLHDRLATSEIRVPVAFDAPRVDDLPPKTKIVKDYDRGAFRTAARDEYGERIKIGPNEYLTRAEAEADFAFTFDFPISPALEVREKKKLAKLSVLNAVWMIDNSRRFPRGDFPIIGVCPGWDAQSYVEFAGDLAALPFSALAVRCVPEITALHGNFFWCETLSKVRSVTDKPLFLLDTDADLATFLFKQKQIYGATGARGVLSFQMPDNTCMPASIAHAIVKLSELNNKPLPLSAYRLRSML